MFENDVISEDLVEFEIEDRKFKYKPTTAGDELDWGNEYWEIDKETKKLKQNIKKRTLCKFSNLVEVPWDKETIKKALGEDKEWQKLTDEQKRKFVSKINPRLFDMVVIKMNLIDGEAQNNIKKNS